MRIEEKRYFEMLAAEHVALAVWRWLREQLAIELVPWVADPRSPQYDQVKADQALKRRRLLEDLRSVIVDASRPELAEVVQPDR